MILKQQRIEEKRLFLTRCGRRIAVHVETSPRDSLLRRQWRVRSARSNRSGRRPAQDRPGWRLAKRRSRWRAQERPGRHFEPAVPSASGKAQRRESDDPQPDYRATKKQRAPPTNKSSARTKALSTISARCAETLPHAQSAARRGAPDRGQHRQAASEATGMLVGVGPRSQRRDFRHGRPPRSRVMCQQWQPE